jgi:hypothetical protein
MLEESPFHVNVISLQRYSMDRRSALSVLTGTTLGAILIQKARAVQPASKSDHIGWVLQVLERINRVKPGMTRSDVLSVFSMEGGLSTGLQRTFVSQDCPYFKVDVAFRAVGWSDRDQEGRVTLIEDPRDEIVSISRPYLAYGVAD